jgi:type IV secretion system protein TrbI
MNAPNGMNLYPTPDRVAGLSRKIIAVLIGAAIVIIVVVLYLAARRRAHAADMSQNAAEDRQFRPAREAAQEIKRQSENRMVRPRLNGPTMDPIPAPNLEERPQSAAIWNVTATPPQQIPQSMYRVGSLPRLDSDEAATAASAADQENARHEREREREAMEAPTTIRSAGRGGAAQQTGTARPGAAGTLAVQPSMVETPPAQLAAETNKEAFLEQAKTPKRTAYLPATRTDPISRYEIKAGWNIPCVLEHDINSDLPGNPTALVSQNVFDSATGRYCLIPQFSKLVGKYNSQVDYGQERVQIVWHRINYPDGTYLEIGGMNGIDSEGTSGIRDRVDKHYIQLFGFTALSSLFTVAFDLSQRRAYGYGGPGAVYPSTGDTAAAAIGRQVSETGSRWIQKNMNVPPTLTIRKGYKFNVHVDRDIAFDRPYW